MRTDPLRVAGWCVVMMAALLFVAEMRRLAGFWNADAPPPLSNARRSPPEPLAPSSATTSSSDAYVGNTNTHKFHRLSCGYATCPNCTARFATRDDAIAAGFRAGGCCQP